MRRFVEKGSSFREHEIRAMVAEQFKIVRNVVAIHKKLQDARQLEVSTTPFYHPILPLVHDTNTAILDREGTTLPSRFSFPEDADAQTAGAITLYERLFGGPPRGMWPAEGAVDDSIIQHLRRHRVGWIATDQGVFEALWPLGISSAQAGIALQSGARATMIRKNVFRSSFGIRS